MDVTEEGEAAAPAGLANRLAAQVDPERRDARTGEGLDEPPRSAADVEHGPSQRDTTTSSASVSRPH